MLPCWLADSQARQWTHVPCQQAVGNIEQTLEWAQCYEMIMQASTTPAHCCEHRHTLEHRKN